MNTSEAYQMIILSKGLVDSIQYDEFAVWWATKGVTQFYLQKEIFKSKVLSYIGLNEKQLKEIVDFTTDSYDNIIYELFDAVQDAMGIVDRIVNIPIRIINDVSTTVRRLATPPGGDWVGMLIGIFIGSTIAINNFRRLRHNRRNRNTDPLVSPRQYVDQRYNFIPTWENPYDPQLAWRVLDVYIFYQTYLETGEWNHEILTPEEVEEYLEDNIVHLFGGSGGAGGGGGSWL